MSNLNDIWGNLFIWILQMASSLFLVSTVISIVHHFFPGKDKHHLIALKNIFVCSILGLVATVALLVMLLAVKDAAWGGRV